MTCLEKKLEKAQPASRNINGLGAEPVCSKDRWSAIGGLGVALLAPFLFPLAVLAGATVAAGRSIGAWLERGRRGPGGGGGGAIAAWRRVGSGFPQKIPQKIFGASTHWRRF
jgi:hypothetical protein